MSLKSPVLLILPAVLLLGSCPATAADPSVSLSVSQSSIAAGQPVTLTASVSDSAGGPAHAIVTFCDATRPHCEDLAILATAAMLPNHKASVTLRPNPGMHSYKAIALGVSSSVQSLTVTGQPQTMVYADPGTFADPENPYSFSVSVLGAASAAPTGSLQIFDATAGTTLATKPLTNVSSALNVFPVPIVTYPGINFYGPAVGDLNNDGYPDLAFVDPRQSSLDIVLSNSQHLLASANSASIPANSAGYTLEGDFNGDGYTDIAMLAGGVKITVVLGNGDGTFKANPPVLNLPLDDDATAFVTADFDSDGILDIVELNSAEPTFSLYHGVGDGTFTFSSSVTVCGSSLATADFNGDGHRDIAITNQCAHTIVVYLGNGDGTFQGGTSSPAVLQNNVVATLLVGDFNGDGVPDLVVSGQTLLLGKGDGTFTAAPKPLPAGTVVSYSGDFNDDGILDLSGLGPTGNAAILLGKGDGTFTVGPSPIPGPGSNVFLPGGAADFNGDGTSDLVLFPTEATYEYATALTVGYLFAGSSSALFQDIYVPGSGQHTIDLVYGGDANNAPSQESFSAAAMAVPTSVALSVPASAAQGSRVTLTAHLFAVNNNSNSATNGELVTFLNGSSTLGTAPLASGIASFSTSQLPVGTDAIQAVYGGDANYAGSTSPVQTIQINGLNGANNSQLKGRYTFLISGSVTGDGPTNNSLAIAAAGSLIADGSGSITSGIEDINSPDGLSSSLPLTGTYSINPGNRGTLTLQAPGEPPQTFALVLESAPTAGALPTVASLISTAPKSIGAGHLVLQSASPGSLASKVFGFTIAGETACLTSCPYLPGGPINANGTLDFSSAGTITGATTANRDFAVAADLALIGSYSTPGTFGRFTLSFSAQNPYGADTPSNYIGYIIDASHFFLLSADSHATFALLSGTAVLQGAP